MASIKSKKNKVVASRKAATAPKKRTTSRAITSTRTVSTTRALTDEEIIRKARNSKYKSRINDKIKPNTMKNYLDYNFLFIMFFLICFDSKNAEGTAGNKSNYNYNRMNYKNYNLYKGNKRVSYAVRAAGRNSFWCNFSKNQKKQSCNQSGNTHSLLTKNIQSN